VQVVKGLLDSDLLSILKPWLQQSMARVIEAAEVGESDAEAEADVLDDALHLLSQLPVSKHNLESSQIARDIANIAREGFADKLPAKIRQKACEIIEEWRTRMSALIAPSGQVNLSMAASHLHLPPPRPEPPSSGDGVPGGPVSNAASGAPGGQQQQQRPSEQSAQQQGRPWTSAKRPGSLYGNKQRPLPGRKGPGPAARWPLSSKRCALLLSRKMLCPSNCCSETGWGPKAGTSS
jgi:hypothetical protein